MKVSVIIPCYNVSEFITACIKSVEEQTYTDLDIICIDDGSEDDTLEVLKKIQNNSTRKISIIQQTNKGAASARNNGILHSDATYIQFLDADDLLQPHKIEHQVQLAIANNNPVMIIGSFIRISMMGDLLFKRVYHEDDQKNMWLMLMNTDLGNTCANFFKKDVFNESVKWPESLSSSQEYDLMFQILKLNKEIVFDSEINTTIRQRVEGSISQQNFKKKWENYTNLRVKIFNHLQQKTPSKITLEVYQNLFDAIRLLYPYNKGLAFKYYKKYIRKKFNPQPSPSTGRLYITLYQLVGFKAAEFLKKMISNKKPF